MNCSREADYVELTRALADSLRKRGYPSELLCRPEFDASLRQRHLEKLRTRQQKDTRYNDQLIVFKCTYSNAIRGLRISKELRHFFKLLRGEVGQDFLREARVVCGYRVEQNCFLRSYRQNFVELHVPPAVGSGS